MRALSAILVLAAAWLGQPEREASRALREAPPAQAERFESIDVFVDSGLAGLAAYQVEVRAQAERVAIVGIEGGEGEYARPPYYDPAAMRNERVILGAISTAEAGALPTGRTRVARLHVMVRGEGMPEYGVTLMTAGGADAARIEATADVQP
jgi:hypothetical protein